MAGARDLSRSDSRVGGGAHSAGHRTAPITGGWAKRGKPRDAATPGIVATHYEAAGDADRASHFASLAAIRAEDALALGQTRLLRLAARAARRLERTRAPWAQGMASLIRAGVASMRGDVRRAAAQLADAEPRLAASDLSHFATACRRRRGELAGGPEGQAMVEDADRWFIDQQVVNPARMAGLLAPGAWSPAKAQA